MSMNDPISDMLTRIRNGLNAGHAAVNMPSSKMKVSVAKVLKDSGYINDYSVEKEGVKSTISITLKYFNEEPVITTIKRISKPGLRVQKQYNKIPQVAEGLGVNIVSTSKGLMTDVQARKSKLGGEIICSVF